MNILTFFNFLSKMSDAILFRSRLNPEGGVLSNEVVHCFIRLKYHFISAPSTLDAKNISGLKFGPYSYLFLVKTV